MSPLAPPLPGTVLDLSLSDAPGDTAQVRVLAGTRRDLLTVPDPTPVLRFFLDAALVEVTVRGRDVIPGAWVDESLAMLDARPHRAPVDPLGLRFPAVVLGEGSDSMLAWGETSWPLPLDGSVRVPDSCRPGVHRVPELRRLTLSALGRGDEVALTRWHQEGFEVPWHDVRLVPHAQWWFDIAQVPRTMRYADAARAQGRPLERFLPRS
ncbi:hypothetical protein [Brachybacterium hainanense]|uniref:Uncharacterized protein n=1 Tax=Brachybacterium hainanense TaxID=1541174 RepID=A0ABV6RE11_9MICO